MQLELAQNIPVQISLSSVTYQGRGHWLEIYGDRGTLVLGSSNLKDNVHGFKLLAAKTGEELCEVEIPKHLDFEYTFADGRIAPLIRIVDRWVEAINTGSDLIPSLKEGLYSQMLMDIARESNDQQRWLEIPEL
jgi:predicted dehydrogenase